MTSTTTRCATTVVFLFLCSGCGGGGGGHDDAGTDPVTEEGTDVAADEGADLEYDGMGEECHASVEGWDPVWAAMEQQAVILVNARRAEGADCGTAGTFDAAGAVTMEPHLRCAARVHSLYMATNGSFGYDSPGGVLGEDLWETVTGAGYGGTVDAQDIGYGMASAEEVVGTLMGSDGDCANLMHPDATQIGVGLAVSTTGDPDHYWTLVHGHE